VRPLIKRLMLTALSERSAIWIKKPRPLIAQVVLLFDGWLWPPGSRKRASRACMASAEALAAMSRAATR
jgi:hypothetical protein